MRFAVKWFDPRCGGSLQEGTTAGIQGGGVQSLRGAPLEPGKDRVVVLSKRS
jgi:hypothetical protein